MDTWTHALKQSILPGTLASIISTVALAACGRREAGSMFAGVNAVSHWVWGERAMRANQPSLRHTLVGYAIHHACSLFWAALFEKACRKTLDRHELPSTATAAAVTTAVACFTDYELTPRRLRPGFEERLSRPSLALVYACFGAGLVLGALLNRR